MLPVRILVRTDIDWAAMTPEEFVGQTQSERPLLFVRFVVEQDVLGRWREAFGSEYLDFRAQLQGISRSSLQSVEGATVTYGFDDFETWYAEAEDELIFPIDDDDIFRPELCSLAEGIDEQCAVVAWRHYQYTYDAAGRPTVQPVKFLVLLSNNWGVRKSFLKHHFPADDARQILVNHKQATRHVARVLGIDAPVQPRPWYSFDLESSRVRAHESPYGMSVKHVGSLTSLSVALAEDDPVEALRRQGLSGHATIPSSMRWAQPWIEDYEAVFRALVGATG